MSVILAWVLYPQFMGDDTFIHIGFIKDFVSGKGFSFTGIKTYGTTSPMWVILGATLTKIISSPELSIRLLSGFFTLTTVYIFYIVLVRSHINKIIIYAALTSLVLNTFFLRWALTGMEATAAMTLLLLIYYFYFLRENLISKYFGGIIFGLSVLIRPEFLGFLIIFTLYIFFAPGNKKKSTFFSLLIAILTVFVWIIFSYFYFGTIVPNTYIAKAGESLFSLQFDNTLRTLKLFVAGNLPEFSLLAFILIVIIRKSVKRKHHFRIISLLKNTLIKYKLILPLIWIAGFYIFYILKDVIVISRYTLMLIPFIILITVSFLEELHKHLNSAFFKTIITLYFAIIVVVFAWMTFKVVKPASDDFVNGFQKTYREVASIIRGNSSSQNTSVALSDVGMIGCYSGARVYDLAGLVDRTRFNYKSYSEYLTTKKPQYLVLREEHKLNDILPENVKTQILFSKEIAGFGINHSNPRTVTLYKLIWQK